MNNKKRTLALFLSLLMLAPGLVSCSESKQNSDTQKTETSSQAEDTSSPAADETAAEEEPALTDGLPDTDLGGYDFRVLGFHVGTTNSTATITAPDYTGEPVNDALRETTLAVEERFNCKITPQLVVNAEAVQMDATTSVNAADNAFDILVGHDHMTFDMGTEGLLYNIHDIEQFDMSKPWWPAHSVNSLTIGDQMFAASSYLSYLGLHWSRCILINKGYADELQLKIPYDLVREGKWTLDAVLNYVAGTSQDLDGNGKITETDRVGFATGSQTWYCMQESMGISPYVRDENGHISLDVDVEKIDTYVNKWRTLTTSKDYLSADGFGEPIFKTGGALLCFGQIGDAYDYYRDTDVSYGFLPSPKFDEIQENYINCCTDRPWAIPRTVGEEQANTIGTIVEALSCQNYQNVLPVYFDVTMKNRTADSPDDAEMLQLIADTRTISFSHAYGLKFHSIMGDLATTKSEVASYIKRNQRVAEKSLEKLIEKFDAIKAVSAE